MDTINLYLALCWLKIIQFWLNYFHACGPKLDQIGFEKSVFPFSELLS